MQRRLFICFGVLGIIGCVGTRSNCQADLSPEGYALYVTAPPGARVVYSLGGRSEQLVVGPSGRERIGSSGGSASVERCRTPED
jgi:hypothetical protein